MSLENNNLKKKLTDGSFEGLYQNSENFKKIEQAKTINEAQEILTKYGYNENSETFKKEIVDLIIENEDQLKKISGGNKIGPTVASTALALITGITPTLPVHSASLNDRLLDLEITQSMKYNNEKLNSNTSKSKKLLHVLIGLVITAAVTVGGIKYYVKEVKATKELIDALCDNKLIKNNGKWTRWENESHNSNAPVGFAMREKDMSLILSRNENVETQLYTLSMFQSSDGTAEAAQSRRNILLTDWTIIFEWLEAKDHLSSDKKIEVAVALLNLIRELTAYGCLDELNYDLDNLAKKTLDCRTADECRQLLKNTLEEWLNKQPDHPETKSLYELFSNNLIQEKIDETELSENKIWELHDNDENSDSIEDHAKTAPLSEMNPQITDADPNNQNKEQSNGAEQEPINQDVLPDPNEHNYQWNNSTENNENEEKQSIKDGIIVRYYYGQEAIQKFLEKNNDIQAEINETEISRRMLEWNRHQLNALCSTEKADQFYFYTTEKPENAPEPAAYDYMPIDDDETQYHKLDSIGNKVSIIQQGLENKIQKNERTEQNTKGQPQQNPELPNANLNEELIPGESAEKSQTLENEKGDEKNNNSITVYFYYGDEAKNQFLDEHGDIKTELTPQELSTKLTEWNIAQLERLYLKTEPGEIWFYSPEEPEDGESTLEYELLPDDYDPDTDEQFTQIYQRVMAINETIEKKLNTRPEAAKNKQKQENQNPEFPHEDLDNELIPGKDYASRKDQVLPLSASTGKQCSLKKEGENEEKFQLEVNGDRMNLLSSKGSEIAFKLNENGELLDPVGLPYVFVRESKLKEFLLKIGYLDPDTRKNKNGQIMFKCAKKYSKKEKNRKRKTIEEHVKTFNKKMQDGFFNGSDINDNILGNHIIAILNEHPNMTE